MCQLPSYAMPRRRVRSRTVVFGGRHRAVRSLRPGMAVHQPAIAAVAQRRHAPPLGVAQAQSCTPRALGTATQLMQSTRARRPKEATQPTGRSAVPREETRASTFRTRVRSGTAAGRRQAPRIARAPPRLELETRHYVGSLCARTAAASRAGVLLCEGGEGSHSAGGHDVCSRVPARRARIEPESRYSGDRNLFDPSPRERTR